MDPSISFADQRARCERKGECAVRCGDGASAKAFPTEPAFTQPCMSIHVEADYRHTQNLTARVQRLRNETGQDIRLLTEAAAWFCDGGFLPMRFPVAEQLNNVMATNLNDFVGSTKEYIEK